MTDLNRDVASIRRSYSAVIVQLKDASGTPISTELPGLPKRFQQAFEACPRKHGEQDLPRFEVTAQEKPGNYSFKFFGGPEHYVDFLEFSPKFLQALAEVLANEYAIYYIGLEFGE